MFLSVSTYAFVLEHCVCYIRTTLTGPKVNRIDKILDAELEWKRFRSEVRDAKQGQELESRYIRLNLDLWREPPHMDEKDKLAELQDLGTRLLKTDEYRSTIERIAHMLVASTFYFSKGRFWYVVQRKFGDVDLYRYDLLQTFFRMRCHDYTCR